MEKNIKSLILAGGVGRRLWPLSTEQYPKQFLKLGETSLFQNTVIRCLKLSDISEIFVVTNEAQKFFVIDQLEELGINAPLENILIEPQGKNTLPAICFGMYVIKKKFGNCCVCVFPSDQILNIEAMETIRQTEKLSSEYLLLFGIIPTFPHIGYGYIKTGNKLIYGFEVIDFKEKPELERAVEYIEEGYLWNSGIFMFYTDIFFRELKVHVPEIFASLEQTEKNIEQIYDELPFISIDHGIIEKSNNMAVVRLDSKWSDLGDFKSMFLESKKNGQGNVLYNCQHISSNSAGNLVCLKKNKIVALLDINDLVVIETPDALFICPLKSSQKINEFINYIKS